MRGALRPSADPMGWHLCSTLALRLDLSGDPTFSQALRRAKDVALSAFAHAAAPFAKVVERLNILRSASFTPVYQVCPAVLLSPFCASICMLRVCSN